MPFSTQLFAKSYELLLAVAIGYVPNHEGGDGLFAQRRPIFLEEVFVARNPVVLVLHPAMVRDALRFRALGGRGLATLRGTYVSTILPTSAPNRSLVHIERTI